MAILYLIEPFSKEDLAQELVLLNLLKELGKRDKMQGFARHFISLLQ